MKSYLILVSLAFFTIFNVRAGQTRFYGNGDLSCNLITSICQDGDGFMWIGTAHGLNKFDGWEFSYYYNNENDTTSLSSNYIIFLFKDNTNTLWIGTNKGLQYYQPYEDTFVSVQFPDGVYPTVEDIIELHNGEIWITTSGWGVFRVDREKLRAHLISEISDTAQTLSFGNIYQDRSNSIWLPFPNRKVLRIVDGASKIYQIFDTPGTISDIVEDAEGRMFVSSFAQVSQWEPVSRKFIPLTNNTGNFMSPKMLHTQKGVIYISSDGQGLRYMDNEKMEIEKMDYINTQKISDNLRIVSMYEDRNGNIWIGCFQKGVLMIPNEKTKFHYWNLKSDKQERDITISSFYKTPQGRLWAGADNGQLLELNPDGRIKSLWYEGKSSISSVFEDSEGTLWVGRRYGGVFMRKKGAAQHKYIPELTPKYIKWITGGSEKDIYFSVFGEGFMIHNLKTGTWRSISDTTSFTNKVKLENNWINTMVYDSKGRMWLGHYAGISCYDALNDCFLDLGLNSRLNKAICYALLEDGRGHIWIGTSHGLYRYVPDSKELRQFATNDGFPDNLICGLAEDESGNIWCSTFQGIRKISPEDGKILSFISGNGLSEREYTRGIYFQDQCGEVYFSSVNGITHFRPEEIQITNISQAPALTNLYLNNQSVSANSLSNRHKISRSLWTETSDITLSYKDNAFSFTFSTLDFRVPGNISYEYRMKETDDKWIILPQGTNRITYNNLPPGKYNLEVKANENGVFSPIRKLVITILPPWYLTTLAKICYLLFLLGCFGLVLYWQTKRMEKKRREEINEEKMKFFINISHEIRSPMTLIISPLSMLMKKEYDDVTTKALHSMYKNANRILTLINQMLDIRKIDKGQMRMTYSETDLVAFISEMIEVYEYQANQRRINLSFQHGPDKLPVWIDRNNFDKVLVNLIGNALKFSGEDGQISLTLTEGEDLKATGALKRYAEILIVDSGIGLDEKTIDRIFDRFYQDKTNALSGSGIGLNLCKTLVELHQGTITAANRQDTKGSCFTIRIPLGNSHLKKEEVVEQYLSPRIILNQNQSTELIASQKKQAVKSKTRNRILIIDDSEELLLYLKEELDVIYKVITCNNANDGLRIALEQNPDLIISDVVMPEMDGFTLLKKVKTNANISHIPVVLLTSKTEYDNRIKGWDKGADAILTKPFSIEELILICSNLISNRLRLKGKFSGAQDQEDKSKPVEVKSNDEEFMGRVMAVINKNMDNPLLSVEMLAEEVGISRVQLHRKLKELAGMSSSEFIKNIRLRHAVDLLKSKKINVSQVAYQVGYTNPALFSMAFKKYFGVSPSEYVEKEEKDS